MITMDVKGITWVRNIYQKFEDTYLEVEEDTVKYIENQLQTVGESVEKFYSDVMQDLLPPSSCDLDEKVTSELPVDQYTDAGLCQKSFQGSKERLLKANAKQTTEDSGIYHIDNYVIYAASSDGSCETDALSKPASSNSEKGNNFIPPSTQYVGSMDIESDLSVDEKRAVTEIFGELTLAETDTCRTSQSCELSNENQNHAVTVSNAASAEVTRLASVADCCNEIENARTEQFPNVPVLVKSAEEKEVNTSSSSSDVLYGDPDEIPDTRSLDVTRIDTVIEQGHKTMQQDAELKLEESCVMVTGDELQLVPKADGNLKTNKKKMWKAFSLSRSSERKQEYKELAVWHENSEKGKGDCWENSDQTLLEDQEKLLLPSVSESEWELL